MQRLEEAALARAGAPQKTAREGSSSRTGAPAQGLPDLRPRIDEIEIDARPAGSFLRVGAGDARDLGDPPEGVARIQNLHGTLEAGERVLLTDEIHVRLSKRYHALLCARLAGAGETALADAERLGHAALGAGLGILEMVALHQSAVERLLSTSKGGVRPAAIVAAARGLLLKSLTPFEMSHRVLREGNMALRRLNDGLEKQSRHIARTLHDNANQLVASMGIAIAALEREPGVRRGRLNEMRAALDQIGSALRRASHELRPPALDDLGVVPALRHFARGLTALRAVDVRFMGSTAGRLAPSLETTLYWVVQEALTNVARHAHARCVRVHLERTTSAITCMISDDGIGFDTEALAGHPDRGLGLISIRERLEAVRGDLEIRSSPGAGTTLTALIPSGAPHGDTSSARG